ncbi:hypothetical protein QL093DRAFT_2090590 [Fusarium oxysporum]|nr:hypothetical protein QL093DRAFT_2090590 [Fusarium oxysporum]
MATEEFDGESGRRTFDVEKITCHKIEEDGKLSFLVKWKDHEGETWEPVEHFKKRQRVKTGNADSTSETSPTTEKEFILPNGSWDNEVERIDACFEDSDGDVMVYLLWPNDKKTRHKRNLDLLDFYEKYAKVPREDENMPGDTLEAVSSQSTAEKLSPPSKS